MDADHCDARRLLEMDNYDYSMQQQHCVTEEIPTINGYKRMRHKKHHSSELSLSNSAEDGLSLVTKRLNEMSVIEREIASYEVHGIPLDHEFYDQELVVKRNNIDNDPEQLNALLEELDRLVEELLESNKNGKDMCTSSKYWSNCDG